MIRLAFVSAVLFTLGCEGVVKLAGIAAKAGRVAGKSQGTEDKNQKGYDAVQGKWLCSGTASDPATGESIMIKGSFWYKGSRHFVSSYTVDLTLSGESASDAKFSIESSGTYIIKDGQLCETPLSVSPKALNGFANRLNTEFTQKTGKGVVANLLTIGEEECSPFRKQGALLSFPSDHVEGFTCSPQK